MVSEPAIPAPADAPGIANATRTQGLQSLGSPAAPSLHSEILSAFAHQTPLPKIIADFHLSPEDLHNFLSTPGIPERLSALRALVRFDRDLRHTAAQADAVSYLQNLLKSSDTTEVEGRRAATALLRGPGGSPPPRAASRTNPAARSDISDWADLPPDDVLDDEEDTEDDADLDTSDGADGASNRVIPKSERKPALPADAPRPPITATPDELISHQLSLIQNYTPERPTPRDLLRAIDFHRLSFPTRAHASLQQAFLSKIPTNLPNLQNAELTPHPATIHDTTPPTATARVTINSNDGLTTSLLFHLRHESTFPNDPNVPHAWHTTAITEDSS